MTSLCSLYNYICHNPSPYKNPQPCHKGSEFLNLKQYNNNAFSLSPTTVKVLNKDYNSLPLLWIKRRFSKLNTFSLYGHITPNQGPKPLTQKHEFYHFGGGLHEHHNYAFSFISHYCGRRRRFNKI